MTVTNPGSQTSAIGTPVSLQVHASDTDGGTLSYNATGLPGGLSINSTTGQITGSPTTAGTSNVTITAIDASGPSGSTAFSWSITPLFGRARTVAVGGSHACAALTSSDVACWGDNKAGQLGDGTSTGPTTCPGAPTSEPCSTTPVMANTITGATAVATGYYHSCALLSAGSVECWGANGNGQLGNGSMTDSLAPVPASGITNATSIAAGWYDSCAVLSTGGVDCWGENSTGQLGGGYPTGPANCGSLDWCSSTPGLVGGIANATAVAVGADHMCALLSTGTVECWGDNNSGQLGDGGPNAVSPPVGVSGITNAIAIAADNNDSCAVLATGHVDCWGYNAYGELGNGTTADTTTPVEVSGITNATGIATGYAHTCATLSTGAVDCWGESAGGQLGNGSTTGPDSCNNDPCSKTPVAVTGITNAKSIAAQGSQTCAVLSTGGIDCWGNNAYGELGNGTTASSPTAVQVSDIF